MMNIPFDATTYKILCAGLISNPLILLVYLVGVDLKAAGKYPYFPGQEPTLRGDLDFLLQVDMSLHQPT